MRSVLIYRDDLLPPSETFIRAQAMGLRRYWPVFTGLREVETSLSLVSEYERIVAEHTSLVPRSLRSRAYRIFGAHPRLQKPSYLAEIRSAKPALVHAHFAPDAVHAIPLAAELDLPLLVTLHGYDVTARDNSRNPLHQLLRRRGLKQLHQRATLFLCVSEFIRDKAIAAGFPADKLLVHRIGVDVSTFQPFHKAGSGNNVLFVGRLVEKKGCEYLIQAMLQVKKQVPSAQLIVVGDGPLRFSLEQFARKIGVAVNFTGRRGHDAVRKYMESARVFAVPSVTAPDGDSEGLPMVLLEAQAMGIPVVATRHAGIPEGILDGKRGLLCDEFDVAGLAHHIAHLLTNQQVWNDHHQRGPAFVCKHFNLLHQTALLEDIYDSVLHSHPKRVSFAGHSQPHRTPASGASQRR
jgi:colanic acid/amylovoran biosynthesis glycosyltransferase